MNKLRIFLAAISLTLSATTWACGWGEEDYNFKVFCMRTPIRQAIDNNNVARDANRAETLDFWYSYTKGAINKDVLCTAIEELDYETFQQNRHKENALTAYLLRQNDRTAIKYLLYNSEIPYGCSGSEWEYHKPYTQTQWRSLLNRVSQLPTTGKLTDRIQFLKVRCLFKIHKYSDIITLWNSRLRNTSNISLRNRIEGYVGGAYFWTNRYNQAVDIFQKYGDIQSINSVVNKILRTSSKESLYAHDPNSIALEYAMQDYANYYYHCMQNKRREEAGVDMYSLYLNDGDVQESVTRDYNSTVAFAERVISEQKTSNPQFWAGFIGFVKWCNGNADDAYQWLVKAEGMQGNSGTALCVRMYKLLAALQMKNKPADFDDYFLREYSYFLGNVRKQQQAYMNAQYGDLVTFTPQENMVYHIFSHDMTDEAISYYGNNNPLSALLLQALSDRTNTYRNYMSMDDTFIRQLDKHNSIDQDISLLKMYTAGGNSKVEKALIAMADGKIISKDIFNDIIGTKLLREMRFDEAKKYLSKVSIAYLNTQCIATYLSHRTWSQTAFKRKEFKEYWDEGSYLTQNVKLQYARDMANRQGNLNLLTGDAKAQAEYEMADRLFQASALGDLWALTEYSWTCDTYGTPYTNQMVQLLRDAELNAESLSVKKKIWYAMASIPNDDHYVSLSYDDNYRIKGWDFSDINSWQQDAYRHLAENVTTSDPLYRSCDVLRSYISQYK